MFLRLLRAHNHSEGRTAFSRVHSAVFLASQIGSDATNTRPDTLSGASRSSHRHRFFIIFKKRILAQGPTVQGGNPIKGNREPRGQKGFVVETLALKMAIQPTRYAGFRSTYHALHDSQQRRGPTFADGRGPAPTSVSTRHPGPLS